MSVYADNLIRWKLQVVKLFSIYLSLSVMLDDEMPLLNKYTVPSGASSPAESEKKPLFWVKKPRHQETTYFYTLESHLVRLDPHLMWGFQELISMRYHHFYISNVLFTLSGWNGRQFKEFLFLKILLLCISFSYLLQSKHVSFWIPYWSLLFTRSYYLPML